MFKFMILACATWALASCQRQEFDYFYDYIDAPADLQAQQPLARPPPPPVQQASRPRARAPQQAPPPPRSRAPQQAPPPPRSRAPPSRPQQRAEIPLDGPRTTPIPILIDSRSIDTKTGAFVYQYAGADGSEKHEFRYPNGTVVGNYTFINDLGERETRVYSAGVVDPNAIDETTDPNYVDLGNYDLYKHLEQPYIHEEFTTNVRERQSRPATQPSRPRAQPRPVSRPVAPRPPRPSPSPFPAPAAPAQLDFNAAAAVFEQAPASRPVFDYEDIAVAPPVPVAPKRPAPAGGQSSRGRAGGRNRIQQAPRPRHRLDFSEQSPDSLLDSLIRQFQ